MADNLAHSIVARWDHPDVKFVPLLREGGIQAVVVTSSNDAFADACRSAGIQIIPAGALQFADWKTLPGGATERAVVLTEGQWPGMARGDGMAQLVMPVPRAPDFIAAIGPVIGTAGRKMV